VDALALTVRELRNSKTVCQNQSNVNAPWDVLYSPHYLCLAEGKNGLLYTSAWGFGVARFDKLGNAKAFGLWSERQNWLHVFRVYVQNKLILVPLEPSD